ncbi:MAG: Uma2 family endonuclease [Leptolyngbya sp. SIO1E4]|nr:Uma2 family endonuclease [Leptolyngbya sp. SIO1E4]
MTGFVVAIPPSTQLTDDQFYDLCRANPDLKIERTAKGELILMPPTGGETGQYNFEIAVDFGIWNRQAKLGVAFDSSTCFKLPNGADRSPDIAWVRQARWDALSPEAREKFPPLAPDFVLELMSPSDALATVQAKMQEYLDNGVQLGWLINRKDQQVEIYCPERPIETLTAPATLSGEAVLPGFVLDLSRLWVG